MSLSPHTPASAGTAAGRAPHHAPAPAAQQGSPDHLSSVLERIQALLLQDPTAVVEIHHSGIEGGVTTLNEPALSPHDWPLFDATGPIPIPPRRLHTTPDGRLLAIDVMSDADLDAEQTIARQIDAGTGQHRDFAGFVMLAEERRRRRAAS